MNTQRITKYFQQKSHPLATVIAVAVAVLGFCVVVFFERWALGLTIMFAGAILFLLLSLQIKDSEVDEGAASEEEKFRKAFEDRYVFGDTRKLHQAEMTGFEPKKPIYDSSYLLQGDGDTLLLRRGGDGKVRSSVYQNLALLVEDHAFCYGIQPVPLTGGTIPAPEFEEIPYQKMSAVCILDPITPHLTHFRILGEDGTCVKEFQIPSDAQTDELVSEINARIQKSRLT